MSNKYWSATVKALTPYVPGEQLQAERLIKLNTNENPYPPSPLVHEALQNAIGKNAANLRLYPDLTALLLRRELAALHGVKPEQIFLGNGSDEVLAHAFQALLKHKYPILFPDISYSFYTVYCGLFGIEYEKVPLTDEYAIRVDDYLRPERQLNGGVVIANPNAPTGVALPAKEIERLIQANKQSVVMIDEAYVDYGGETVIPLIQQHENLLVVRTFSKSRALAGLRIGYAVGQESLIQALERVKDSFNSYPVDTLAQVAATASVKDQTYFEEKLLAVNASRKWLSEAMQDLGFKVLPSSTNFIFAKSTKKPAAEILQALKERNILVRYFKAPRIDQFLRISIGTQDECEALVAAIKEILAA